MPAVNDAKRGVAAAVAAAVALAVAAGVGGCRASGPETFRAVAVEQEGTLLSGFVAPDGTAYLAGGVVRGGAGLLLRWDGRTLTTVPTPGAHAFWWIHGANEHEMWLAGEAGEVHRFDGISLTRVETGAPADATLFGVWGTAAEGVWAVGGSFITGGPRGVIRRLSGMGMGWDSVASPDDVDADVTYFKVWGVERGDVWIVGDRGVVLRDRRDGAGLVRAPAPGVERYVTVHGCGASDVYVVGGGGSGALARFDGAGWTTPALAGAPFLFGVSCVGGAAYVGGFFGYAARIGAGGPPQPIAVPAAVQELGIHAIVSGAGRVLALGGDLVATAQMPQRGFVLELPVDDD